MDGLIIKKEWLDKIFSGKKTLEIRGCNTKKRGRIALIESGTKTIVGDVVLGGVNYLQDFQFDDLRSNHHIIGKSPYKKTFSWSLLFARKYDKPIPYKHPQGAVIWVKDVL